MDLIDERMPETGAETGVTVSVTGKATIRVAAELKERLVDAIDATGGVTVDVSGITGADASFFQLLCSAHHTACARGQGFRLSSNRSEEFLAAAVAIGFGQSGSSCTYGNCIL